MCLRLILVISSINLLSKCASAEVGVYDKISKLFNECVKKEEVVKCFKIHALKVLDRAVNTRRLYVNEYIQLVNSDTARSFNTRISKNDSKLEDLKTEKIDEMLLESASKFMESHKLELKLPSLIDVGRAKGGGGGGGGFGNKGGGGNIGVLLGALAIKGTFLAMAYKGIAIMSGTALLVGKMALMLSAILGLKKLVGGGEKTTFEIVKHPKYSESHTHSTSYEDDGYYHRRNYLEDLPAQTTAYKFYSTK